MSTQPNTPYQYPNMNKYRNISLSVECILLQN